MRSLWSSTVTMTSMHLGHGHFVRMSHQPGRTRPLQAAYPRLRLRSDTRGAGIAGVQGFKLVVTVDNGIPPSRRPPAQRSWALTSSSRITTCRATRCQTPSPLSTQAPRRRKPVQGLCGAGVAFKLCAALEGCDPAELLEMYGELAALGTVADVMPLVGENRTIVREGLSLLQDTMRPACTRFWRAPAAAASPSRRTRSATVWPRA